MDDLISRKAAIEYFLLNTTWYDEEGNTIDDWDEKRKLLEDDFNGIPSAKQWTPCSERLPTEEIDEITEDYKEYLCVRCVSNERQVISVYKFGKGAWWNGLLKVEEPFPVIAWQPLPEPYVEV